MRSLGISIISILFALLVLVSPAAQAQSFSVIHSFTGTQDGANPTATLIFDSAGNLYGSTFSGNTVRGRDCSDQGGCGVTFKMSHRGAGWTLNPLWAFTGYDDGAGPVAAVSFGPGGLLYGTASNGGDGSCMSGWFLGCGVVYSLQPPATPCTTATCAWNEMPIYQFSSLNDGFMPVSNVVSDQAGNLYGTTEAGGNNGPCRGGCGTIFQLTRSGSGWQKTTLYQFTGGNDGGYPEGNIVMDRLGNLYGTAVNGGAPDAGTIFQLTPSGSHWTFNVIYTFQNTDDGAFPYGGVIADATGNLYGATSTGGTGGGGTVFELSPSGGGWTFSILYPLSGVPHYPGVFGPLAFDRSGNLYGTSEANGAHQCGYVFKLTPSNGQWNYNDLYDFTCGNDGGVPEGGPALDSSGNIYGTTVYYGPTSNEICGVEQEPAGCGVVWEITQ